MEEGGVGGFGADDVGAAFLFSARGGRDGFLDVLARGGAALLPEAFFVTGGAGLREDGGGGASEFDPMPSCYQGLANLIALTRIAGANFAD